MKVSNYFNYTFIWPQVLIWLTFTHLPYENPYLNSLLMHITFPIMAAADEITDIRDNFITSNCFWMKNVDINHVMKLALSGFTYCPRQNPWDPECFRNKCKWTSLVFCFCFFPTLGNWVKSKLPCNLQISSFIWFIQHLQCQRQQESHSVIAPPLCFTGCKPRPVWRSWFFYIEC